MEISELVVESQLDRTPRRRQYPRHPLRSLAYVKLNETNGGIIRDLGEAGIAIQAVAPLRPDQELDLQFDLLSPRVRVEARGRVCWADASGQGGIQFCGLAPKVQSALREWMLMQMLSTAALSGRDSMFSSLDSQLMLSSGARAAIILNRPKERVQAPLLRWGRFRLSSRNFSFLVDAIIVLCAILLFSTAALIMMGGIPAWPLSTGLFFSCSIIFVTVYHLMFAELLGGATLGKRLALLAERESEEELVPRFR